MTDEPSHEEAGVSFDGGPLDGVILTGLFARVIVDNDPPFACMDVEGRYEHYIKTEDCECGISPCYAFVGECRDLTDHPPRGTAAR